MQQANISDVFATEFRNTKGANNPQIRKKRKLLFATVSSVLSLSVNLYKYSKVIPSEMLLTNCKMADAGKKPKLSTAPTNG